MNDRNEEAERIMVKLHARNDDPNHEFARSELFIIKKQIDHEKAARKPWNQALKQRPLQKRFLVGWMAIWCTQVSGVIVVLCKNSFCAVLTDYMLTLFCSISVDDLSRPRLLAFHRICPWWSVVHHELRRQLHWRCCRRLRWQITTTRLAETIVTSVC